MFHDNQSSMKWETNGKASSDKRTRCRKIKYFLITNLIARNEVSLQFCPTEIADCMTKPLVGKKFIEFRKGSSSQQNRLGQQECVGKVYGE